tara:strand:+ start:453 stop:1541 length:1089 start_codon:yes stop_codon:yes gene_type:complete
MLQNKNERRLKGWLSKDLQQSKHWRFSFDDKTRKFLTLFSKTYYQTDCNLFDYEYPEMDLGPALPIIDQAVEETMQGGGLVVLDNLPRDELTEEEFGFLNWAIGLHVGVPRPQGKSSQYMAKVQDVGTDYRAASGRGFSSNAKLTFHTDGADISTLGCFNTAKSGGMSMITSSTAVWHQFVKERPDLVEAVQEELFYFSRQQEEAADEGPFYGQKLFEKCEGLVFGKWNWNRLRTAQDIDGVPEYSEKQIEILKSLGEIIQRSTHLHTMYLKPGDLQIMNNNTVFHSRSAYEDFEEADKKRLLYRLWISPVRSPRLPESWKDFYRETRPNMVRGGIRGHQFDELCQEFDDRHAQMRGMLLSD